MQQKVKEAGAKSQNRSQADVKATAVETEYFS